MRGVRILVSITLLATAGGAHASSLVATGSGPQTARASIDVSVTVPRVMRLLLLDHPATIAVSAEDVARGFVRVSGPRIDLLVNDRQGYAMRAELTGAAFTEARIAGLPAAVTATREGVLAQMPTMVGRSRPQPFAVVYELKLSPDAAPGQHAWPVALTLAGF
jgi:hypothetical protein